jgi:hypothetical protein
MRSDKSIDLEVSTVFFFDGPFSTKLFFRVKEAKRLRPADNFDSYGTLL